MNNDAKRRPERKYKKGEKRLKSYSTNRKLKEAQAALEKEGVWCRTSGDSWIMVHVADFIKARDILLDLEDLQKVA